VVDQSTGEREWMWLLVERSHDAARFVFGTLDSEPVAVSNMHLGQEPAISYENIRAHRLFSDPPQVNPR